MLRSSAAPPSWAASDGAGAVEMGNAAPRWSADAEAALPSAGLSDEPPPSSSAPPPPPIPKRSPPPLPAYRPLQVLPSSPTSPSLSSALRRSSAAAPPSPSSSSSPSWKTAAAGGGRPWLRLCGAALLALLVLLPIVVLCSLYGAKAGPWASNNASPSPPIISGDVSSSSSPSAPSSFSSPPLSLSSSPSSPFPVSSSSALSPGSPSAALSSPSALPSSPARFPTSPSTAAPTSSSASSPAPSSTTSPTVSSPIAETPSSSSATAVAVAFSSLSTHSASASASSSSLPASALARSSSPIASSSLASPSSSLPSSRASSTSSSPFFAASLSASSSLSSSRSPSSSAALSSSPSVLSSSLSPSSAASPTSSSAASPAPPASTAPLLTQLTSVQPAFAVSTRRLGNVSRCLQITRSVDLAVLDVGFGANGWLDTAALLSFVSLNGSAAAANSTGSVSIWYDQSGRGHHLYNPSLPQQPLIVNQGVLQTFTTLPVLRFQQSAGSFLQLINLTMQVAYVSTIVQRDNVQSIYSLFGGANWYGGNAFDNTMTDLLDPAYCSPDVCGPGSWGLYNNANYTPAFTIPHRATMLNAFALHTARPAGNTAISSIGNSEPSFSTNSGSYLEVVVWDTAAPSAVDQSLLYQDQLALTQPSQHCVALSDATSCLQTLMQTTAGSSVLRIPVANAVFPIASIIYLNANQVFDGNNATFVLLYFAGHGWYDYMLCAAANSVVRNVTITAPYPSYGICVSNQASNIEFDHFHVIGVSGTAMSFGDYISNVWVHDSTFTQVGYAILIDNNFVSGVLIERCTFHNNSADAIALNSPVLTSQLYSYWSTAWAITNVTIRNNVITNIRNDMDQSMGFCISSAGGQYVYILNNTLSGCSWQAIHLEDTSSYIYIVGNSIDWVYGNTALAWAGGLDGVWLENSAQVLIANNSFTRIGSSAVTVVGMDRLCLVNQNYPAYAYHAIFVPWFYQTSHDINITGNTFVDWGLDGLARSYGLQVGTYPGETDAVTRLSYNSYNPNKTTTVLCECISGAAGASLIENEPQLSQTCAFKVFSDASCNVATTKCPVPSLPPAVSSSSSSTARGG